MTMSLIFCGQMFFNLVGQNVRSSMQHSLLQLQRETKDANTQEQDRQHQEPWRE